MQMTYTETHNQIDCNNITLWILFSSNICSKLLPPKSNKHMRRVTTLIASKCKMSPSFSATVSRMEFYNPPVWLRNPSTTTMKNLPRSFVMILRATEFYNPDLSLVQSTSNKHYYTFCIFFFHVSIWIINTHTENE